MPPPCRLRVPEIIGNDPIIVFFKLYNGRCWCSERESNYSKHGASTACTHECPGDSSEYCGGYYAMTVSKTSQYETPAGYLGCFQDDADNRVLNEAAFSVSGMTTEVSFSCVRV